MNTNGAAARGGEMGDIADMMLDGALCQECGGYIEQDEDLGYPVTCPECEAEAARQEPQS